MIILITSILGMNRAFAFDAAELKNEIRSKLAVSANGVTFDKFEVAGSVVSIGYTVSDDVPTPGTPGYVYTELKFDLKELKQWTEIDAIKNVVADNFQIICATEKSRCLQVKTCYLGNQTNCDNKKEFGTSLNTDQLARSDAFELKRAFLRLQILSSSQPNQDPLSCRFTPSREATSNYLKQKLTGMDWKSGWRTTSRIEDISFADSQVSLIVNVKEERSDVTTWTYSVDLGKIENFSELSCLEYIAATTDPIVLQCSDRWGRCIDVKKCAKGTCSSMRRQRLSINPSLAEVDKLRVRKTIVHLKSFSPERIPGELFDRP